MMFTEEYPAFPSHVVFSCLKVRLLKKSWQIRTRGKEMIKSIEERVKKLEDLLKINQSKRRIAIAIYNPEICPQANLP